VETVSSHIRKDPRTRQSCTLATMFTQHPSLPQYPPREIHPLQVSLHPLCFLYLFSPFLCLSLFLTLFLAVDNAFVIAYANFTATRNLEPEASRSLFLLELYPCFPPSLPYAASFFMSSCTFWL